MKRKVVVLLSSGLDSAANLGLASYYDEIVLAITCDYGQRAAQREIAHARKLCEHFGVTHTVVGLPWLAEIGGSALTDSRMVMPEVAATLLDDPQTTQKSAKQVWVPNRNGVMIHVAATYAEKLGASHLLVGFNAEEAVTFPDNSPEYMRAATQALAFSTANHVTVDSYTVQWNKKQIVRELRAQLPSFPFEMIWSCYEGSETSCGRCESCQRLQRALRG